MFCTKCNKEKSSTVNRNGKTICKDCDNMIRFERREKGFFICPICGKADSPTNWTGGLPRGLCFHCSFWNEKLEDMKNRPDRFVVIKGSLYFIGEELPKDYKGFKGFGGTKFVIEKFDGTKITSRNLWHNGGIPTRFRNLFPDNAEFVKE